MDIKFLLSHFYMHINWHGSSLINIFSEEQLFKLRKEIIINALQIKKTIGYIHI